MNRIDARLDEEPKDQDLYAELKGPAVPVVALFPQKGAFPNNDSWFLAEIDKDGKPVDNQKYEPWDFPCNFLVTEIFVFDGFEGKTDYSSEKKSLFSYKNSANAHDFGQARGRPMH